MLKYKKLKKKYYFWRKTCKIKKIEKKLKVFKGALLQKSNSNSIEIIVKSKAKERSFELKKSSELALKILKIIGFKVW